ncbi:MAG: galactonate dehydratase [Chloroflexota bacterium]
MRVTGIETLEGGRWKFVRVNTDEGLSGVGELHPGSGTGGTPRSVRAAARQCAEYLVGENPLEIERHWQHMFRRCLFRGGPDAMSAIGAIDMALWDIKGKAAGLPVYALLGGPVRDRVRVYRHMQGATPDELAAEARRLVSEGNTAVRFYPLGDFASAEMADASYSRVVGMVEERVAAVRQAVGPDVDIMIDPVCRLTPPEALAVARAIEGSRPFFFEDPIEPDNLDAQAQLTAQSPIPIATGERLYTIYQFRDLLDRHAAAYIRPDISLAGGISGLKKIAALAEAEYVGMVPHNPLGPVATAACVQVDAAVHNVPVQEYPGREDTAPARDMVKAPIPYEDGYLTLPDAPGLGVELDDEGIRSHPPEPYARTPVIRPDGSLRDY